MYHCDCHHLKAIYTVMINNIHLLQKIDLTALAWQKKSVFGSVFLNVLNWQNSLLHRDLILDDHPSKYLRY